VQQTEVARQTDAGSLVLTRAKLEDIEGAGEEERELQRCTDGAVGVVRGVVRREDGCVERVVLVWTLVVN
jgi:hypothetical protein